MPYQLSKPPVGLLELMRLKVGGKQPTLFSETVVPVLEVSDFYAADILLNTSGAPTVGALANLLETLTFTTALRVHAVCATLVIGAAPATNIHVSWGYSLSGAEIGIGSQFIAQANAGAVLFCGSPFPGLVLPASAILIARASGTAAGVDHSLDVTATVDNYTAP